MPQTSWTPPGNSPWGVPDHQEQISNGVWDISTPSHGGIMVYKTIAELNLTPEALAIGERFGSFYCYEEDCNWAIPLFEQPLWLKALAEKNENVVEEITQYVMDVLNRWHKSYLGGRSI